MKIMENEYVHIALDFITKIVIISLVTLLITFVLSKFVFESNLAKTLENSAMILMAIGLSSLMGGAKIRQKPEYLMAKLTIGANNSTTQDLRLFAESYGFCVKLGTSGLVLLFVSYFLW